MKVFRSRLACNFLRLCIISLFIHLSICLLYNYYYNNYYYYYYYHHYHYYHYYYWQAKSMFTVFCLTINHMIFIWSQPLISSKYLFSNIFRSYGRSLDVLCNKKRQFAWYKCYRYPPPPRPPNNKWYFDLPFTSCINQIDVVNISDRVHTKSWNAKLTF